jgi:cytoskeletal protein CcmA (bactofilin family)
MDISGNLAVMGNLLTRNNTYLGGNTYITGNVKYSNVEIAYENVTISDKYTYNPSIINFYVDDWDNLRKPVNMPTRDYVDASLNMKAPIASPVFTGIPTAPTPSIDNSSNQLATTAFVKNQYYLKSATAASTYAPIYNPDLSGIPTAPTADIKTSTSQIATTAFVKNAISDIAESITLTKLDNTWSGNNIFTKDIYIHGTRFGTMDGSSIVIGNSYLSSLTSGTNKIKLTEPYLGSESSRNAYVKLGILIVLEHSQHSFD